MNRVHAPINIPQYQQVSWRKGARSQHLNCTLFPTPHHTTTRSLQRLQRSIHRWGATRTGKIDGARGRSKGLKGGFHPRRGRGMIEGGSVYRRGKRWTGQLLSQLGSPSRGGKGLRRNPIRFDSPPPRPVERKRFANWRVDKIGGWFLDALFHSRRVGFSFSSNCELWRCFFKIFLSCIYFFRVNQDLVEMYIWQSLKIFIIKYS